MLRLVTWIVEHAIGSGSLSGWPIPWSRGQEAGGGG